MRREILQSVAAFLAAASVFVSSAPAGKDLAAPDARERAGSIGLIVFQDLPSGASILLGNYQDGLDKAFAALNERPYRYPLERKTNICAAQVKLGQFEFANMSCEAALDARARTASVKSRRQLLAVAHVNHGVVHLMQGDREFAIEEFRRARVMFPGLRIAASNLALAESSELKPHVVVGETL